jgi:phage-related protein
MTEQSEEWSIVFYTDEGGCTPVEDFLSDLDLKTQARFDWSIEQLRVLNVQAKEPLVKHVEGKIWELRRASSRNIYRLLYFFFTGREIVFVHGFQKKTQKIPRQELQMRESEWRITSVGKRVKRHDKRKNERSRSRRKTKL